jgi:hypothetical protein
MKYRQLGDSDLNISVVTLGSWLTYGGGAERQKAEARYARSGSNNFKILGYEFYLGKSNEFPVFQILETKAQGHQQDAKKDCIGPDPPQ